MTVQEGDKVPEFTFLSLVEGKPTPISTKDILPGKKVVIVAVPGAFTPTCTNDHCPGFTRGAKDLLSKGVDAVYCTSVNDPFVMDAFSNFLKATGKITMLSDNGEFAKSLGLSMDLPQLNFGIRSQRYAMIVEDGVIKYLGVDAKGLDKSSFEAVAEKL
eukprot:gene2348-2816_t